MVRKKMTAGVVLAAGMSSRFGEPKQLLQLGGKSVLERTLNACTDSKLERIYLILGYQYQQILKALSEKIQHPRINVIVNRKYFKGQSTSLRTGIFEIRDSFPSVMFILGDQPFVDSLTLNHLLDCFWASEKTSVCHFIKSKEAIR